MNAMFRLAASAALLAAALLAAPAAAQGLPNDVVMAKGELTAEGRKQVADFVQSAAERFAEADPAAIADMRSDMFEQMRNPNISMSFRRAFGAEFTKAFKRFTDDKDPLRATNAFIVARYVGTAETIDWIAANLDPNAQAEVSIRIAAAAQLAEAMEAPRSFSPPQLDNMAKRLSGLARRETDWVVVGHELETLAQLLRTPGLPTPVAESIAASLTSAINDIAAKVMDGSAPELVNALQRGLLAVRDRTVNAPASARTKLLDGIAPTVQKIAGMKGKFPKAVADAGLGDTFDATAKTASLLTAMRAKTGK
jgi:hypothetical protein